MKNTFSTQLKHFRKSAGISQSELGRLSGLTAAAICQLEKEDRDPMLSTIQKISIALNRDIEDFFSTPSKTSKLSSKFYSKFGVLNRLSDKDQKLILQLANSFEKRKTK